jgi:hypothetical protein
MKLGNPTIEKNESSQYVISKLQNFIKFGNYLIFHPITSFQYIWYDIYIQVNDYYENASL